MRLIIPEEIKEKQKIYEPYVHYVKGEGVVLVSDAPPEVVKVKKEVEAWFDEHSMK